MWVVNGRAVAPPCTFCRIGVSTSVKPLAQKAVRSAPTARLRDARIFAESGLTIRSTDRLRTLASGSFRPVRRDGSGFNDFEAIRQSDTISERSPLRLGPRMPVALTMSPRSTPRRQRPRATGSTTERSRTSCSVADSPATTAKLTPPKSRRATTRPVALTISPSGWAITSGSVPERGTETG